MSDLLPPPPGQPSSGVPVPRPGPPRRPGVVTGAAVILIVAGILAAVAGLFVLNGGGALEVPGADTDGGVETLVALGFLALGAFDVVAGVLVLRLSSAGRVLGIVIAGLGILTGLAQLGSSGSSGLLSIALYAFVLYALIAYGFVFRQAAAAR
jgi:hypothetical protein